MSSSRVAREQLTTHSEQAARWWADFLCSDVTHDTGEFKTTTYANYFSNKKDEQFSATEVAAFEDALCDILQDEDRPMVYTEYDPGPLLQQAADQAGIDIGKFSFPVKTHMTIGPREIYVVPGGGARRRTLDEWYQEVTSDEPDQHQESHRWGCPAVRGGASCAPAAPPTSRVAATARADTLAVDHDVHRAVLGRRVRGRLVERARPTEGSRARTRPREIHRRDGG